ncbi:MAG: hypothetical protein LBU42_00500 [Prevotellaceae bacterium]|jgi:hypothetical protein|nr:hypothetical protein [Prevotellaceae bacterium]
MGFGTLAARVATLPKGCKRLAARAATLPKGYKRFAARAATLPKGCKRFAARAATLPKGCKRLAARVGRGKKAIWYTTICIHCLLSFIYCLCSFFAALGLFPNTNQSYKTTPRYDFLFAANDLRSFILCTFKQKRNADFNLLYFEALATYAKYKLMSAFC